MKLPYLLSNLVVACLIFIHTFLIYNFLPDQISIKIFANNVFKYAYYASILANLAVLFFWYIYDSQGKGSSTLDVISAYYMVSVVSYFGLAALSGELFYFISFFLSFIILASSMVLRTVIFNE